MNISNALMGQVVSSSYAANQSLISKSFPDATVKSGINQPAGSYTINISDEAKAMSVQNNVGEVDQVKNDTVSSIEYSILAADKERLMFFPETFYDLIPDTAKVGKIGTPAEVRSNLNAEQVADQNEYISMMAKFFHEESNKLGINSNADYLNQTRNNDQLNGKIYQAIQDRLATDQYAMELKQKVFAIS